MAGSEESPSILVWFEDNQRGHAALRHAQELADAQRAHLTVPTVATTERVIGCGRCLQGTVLWNIEMQKRSPRKNRGRESPSTPACSAQQYGGRDVREQLVAPGAQH